MEEVANLVEGEENEQTGLRVRVVTEKNIANMQMT